MPMEKSYTPNDSEPALQQRWAGLGLYRFVDNPNQAIFSIDTPPPTVSGNLHLGHVYSYSHADFFARFQRLRGMNVFYPMGFDDNGLPTERLVEKKYGLQAAQISREEFIQKCLLVSEEAEREYRQLWQRLGLSVDWEHTYRTIDESSRRISQLSFIDLYRKGLIYRREAPSLYCPECCTAIAQADVEDALRKSEMITIPFTLSDGKTLPIATTRPELLAACVAVFVHPQDQRFTAFLGSEATVPIYGHKVRILADPAVEPEKGSGAVMCCTFGDLTDVNWWQTHHLDTIQALDLQGRMTAATGPLETLSVPDARREIQSLLAQHQLILAREFIDQTVRVHERCDTPVEVIITQQWFVRLLDNLEKFIQAGEQIRWHPEHMRARYRSWVQNLNWDWCISRQRYFGVPFPVWYCAACGSVMLADEDELPVDPLRQKPARACQQCAGEDFIPEKDVMDTWATSSLSPLIVSQWLENPGLHQRVFPFNLRPQGHEIIRTWAFYSIVKSLYHFERLPWSDVLISGWGIAGEGMGKISKSRGGGPMPPLEMIQRYSADALRYWAASTSPGKDAVISEQKVQAGARLVNKLWNAARFAEPFILEAPACIDLQQLTPADRWIRARCAQVVDSVEKAMLAYEYAAAKNEIEVFFWRDLADNYLEMAKQRLYDPQAREHSAACHTLRMVLNAVVKILSPFLPFVTDAVFLALFAKDEDLPSVHVSAWPQSDALYPVENRDQDAAAGEVLVAIATAVRRYKSDNNLSLATRLDRLQLVPDPRYQVLLEQAQPDLSSVTRAGVIEVVSEISADHPYIELEKIARMAVIPAAAI